MHLHRNSQDVVIAGAGIAAAACALRLCALGFRPLLLGRTCGALPGIEAIPANVLPLFTELGAENILKDAGATMVYGFENQWNFEKPTLRAGYWIHVERDKLASAALREAVKRGASFRVCRNLPTLQRQPKQVHITLDGESLVFEAAIDATGRAAAWSRPILRAGRQIADLYDCDPDRARPSAKIARLSEGWAYSLGVRNRRSLAILSAVERNRLVPCSLLKKTFSISGCWFVGRRPAFPQWSAFPVNGRRLAVGDAALAYDPLAGQGIRFALSSAITATSVINTWRRMPSESAAAERFYREFVRRARESHLQLVNRAWANASGPQEKPLFVPEILMFAEEIVPTPLQFNGTIYTDLAFRLSNNDSARWVGEIDLLELRNSLPRTFRPSDLRTLFMSRWGDDQKAQTFLEWSLLNQIVVAGQVSARPLRL